MTEGPDLDLTAELEDYTAVFGVVEADQLPLHRPCDCLIELVPDANLLVGQIDSLSEPELAALQEFIDKNL